MSLTYDDPLYDLAHEADCLERRDGYQVDPRELGFDPQEFCNHKWRTDINGLVRCLTCRARIEDVEDWQ